MKALIVVDIQNDFLPGGALPVPDGDKVIPVINRLIPHFDIVLATQDWHPADHKSFAINHQNKKPGDVIDMNGLPQILWPVHCVQNSHGAEFSRKLDQKDIKKIFVKGTDPEIDSYSGFFDNGHRKSTGLSDYLRKIHTDEVTVVGLAADYCVKFTALDSISEGFATSVIRDATRAVNLHKNDFDLSMKELIEAGVTLLSSDKILL